MSKNAENDRTERLSRLQGLVADERHEFPQLDKEALDTAMAQLLESDQRKSKLKLAGWFLIVVVLLLVVTLIILRLR